MNQKSQIIEEINDGNLYLRKISKEDIEFVFDSLNNKELITYLALGPLETYEHSKRLIKGYLRYWNSNLQYNYIIELHEGVKIKIGSISLWNVNWQHQRAQIGIWLIPSFWNKGLGEKSLILLKNIAFNHLKINRLEAYIAVENTKSIFLFKKCGFIQEGRLREYLRFHGSFHDALIMTCLKK
ncbi:MAG: GNAT family N-acetyltransferase [Promethearchaeota archaeon]